MADKSQPRLVVPLGTHDCRLTDLPNDYYLSISKLVSHVKNVIADNEWYHGMTCEKFYIGKSHVHTWRGRTFEPHKPTTTWNREAVRSRWSDHWKRGFDNMAVLTVVTRDSLPPLKSRNPAVWKQQYTLALEQALITHFMFVEDDPRLENETTQPGKLESGAAVGYVVYLAMKFIDPTPPAATANCAPPGSPTFTIKVEDDWEIVDYPRACNDYTTSLSPRDPSTRQHQVTSTRSSVTTPSTTPTSGSSTQFSVTRRYTPRTSLRNYTTPLSPEDPSRRDTVTYTPSTGTSPITSNPTHTSANQQVSSTSTSVTRRYTPRPSPQNYTTPYTGNTQGIATRLTPTSATTIPPSASQPAPVVTREETPPPSDSPKSWATSLCRFLFPPSPSTYKLSPTTQGYPVLSWGNGVKPCRCGSTEHKLTSHHTCPLRNPCKCGSTTHQRTNHSSCPLNRRYRY